MAEKSGKPVSRTQPRKEDGAMDSIFHQTDETFYETQYLKGFPGYASNPLSTRPASSASDDGAQMKRVFQSEEGKSTEQRYRERFHQLHRSQQAPVGSQRCLRNAEAMESVKQRTHGVKSHVDNDMSNLLFPGCSAGDEWGRKKPETVGDAKQTMTHGKRTNSDKSGSCLWKILNPDSASPISSASKASGGDQKEHRKQDGQNMDRKKAETNDANDSVKEQQPLEEVNAEQVADEKSSIEQPQSSEAEKQNP